MNPERSSQPSSTAKSGAARSSDQNQGDPANEEPVKGEHLARACLEVGLVFGCFALFAGQLPPDINESHYLTKAKHFWDAGYCPDDIFLGSAHSHWLFYAVLGWLTQLFSLEATAWIGRIVTWLLLAVGWCRLSSAITRMPWLGFVSAILFLLLNDRFHLAGEWVVGGFEAKGIAYGFVLLGLERAVRERWNWVWPLLGMASAFHVLVGGWSVLATGVVFIFIDWPYVATKIKSQIVPLAIGLAIAMIGILPPILADWGTTAEIRDIAAHVYVHERIRHHLLFGAFQTIHVARFALLVAAWGMLTQIGWLDRRFRALHYFCFGSLVISLIGLILSGMAEQEQPATWVTSLLRFYWFRLSDFAIPMGVAISCSYLLGISLRRPVLSNARSTPRETATSQTVAAGNSTTIKAGNRTTALICLILLALAFGASIFSRYQDPRPFADRRVLPTYDDNQTRTIETFENWKRVCYWIQKNTSADAVFITPAQQQTFKWYAGRTEVASWKDTPQDAVSIVEWRGRLERVYVAQKKYLGGLMALDDQQLTALAKEMGADYLVVRQADVDIANPPTTLKQVYPEDRNTRTTFVVLAID